MEPRVSGSRRGRPTGFCLSRLERALQRALQLALQLVVELVQDLQSALLFVLV